MEGSRVSWHGCGVWKSRRERAEFVLLLLLLLLLLLMLMLVIYLSL